MTSCHFSFDGSDSASSDGTATGSDASGSGTDSGGTTSGSTDWLPSLADEVRSSQSSYTESSGTVYVDYSDVRQRIDGFGGSNAWTGLPSDSTAKATVVKLLFSRTDGIGLSILRNRIPFREYHYDSGTGNTYDDAFINRNTDKSYIYTSNSNGTKTFSLNWSCWDLGNTKTLITAIKALSNGPESLTVMSTPWTPPNNSATKWKIDYSGGTAIDYANTPDVGGALDPNHYADYADLLADYANNFKANMGATLSVLSIQNEPTWCPSYESCYWTPANVRDFLIVLRSRFALKGVSTSLGVLAAEDENFEEDMVTPTLASTTAEPVISYVGVHQYDYSETLLAAKALPSVASAGKRLWMTEVSKGSTSDSSITDGLFWARMVHYDMTIPETSAFLYWWLWQNTGSLSNSALLGVNGSTVTANKSLYTIGQYSRFVRPGWRRIGTTKLPSGEVYSSAYKNPASKEIAFVLINNNSSAKSVSVSVSGVTGFSTLTAYRTSSTENLASIIAPSFSSSSSSLSVTLPAYSVTTLYGTVN